MQKQHSRNLLPTQVWDQQVRRSPVEHQPTMRDDTAAVVTTGNGGKFIPLKMFPLFREDGMMNSTLTISFEMAELSNMIINPVRATAAAYFVPKLALDRFPDMGAIDRSWNGEPEIDASVIPWFKPLTGNPSTDWPILETLGLHGSAVDTPNDEYVEAYNQVWNYIATQRSPSLVKRDILDPSLAPAFWEHTQMRYVKPTFDEAMVSGRVPLSFVGGTEQLPIYWDKQTPTTQVTSTDAEEAGKWKFIQSGDATNSIWAELNSDSAVISLADIDLARETVAWSRLRNQYQGLSDEWMMDQMLAGIRIPDQSLKNPMLIDHSSTIFGLEERYATDGANLSESVAQGRTAVQLNMRVPRTSCGGVVVVVAQCLPEQLYERQRDHYFMASSVADLPNRTADELDPQPVDMVKNKEVDESHTLPDDLFGYQPLNAKWIRTTPRVGGDYYKASPTAPWTEIRNRIWDTNVVDPELGPDFYLATDIKQDVFANQTVDTFEFWCSGTARINGLTYFGPELLEGSDDYAKVVAQVDTEALKGDGTDV